MTALAVFLCSFGYIGYFPVASGTVGSAAGLIVYLLIQTVDAPYGQAAAIAILSAAGIWSGTLAERYFGTTDPSQGVIDEVVGMLITLFAIHAGWAGLGVGFLLFRMFDVIKPFPAGRLEDLPGGLGMMADDAMAAVYANVVLRVLIMVWPGLAG